MVLYEIFMDSFVNKNGFKDLTEKVDYLKELGIEIVGDAKVRIAVDENEDEWEEITDEDDKENIMEEIDKTVKEDFIQENK